MFKRRISRAWCCWVKLCDHLWSRKKNQIQLHKLILGIFFCCFLILNTVFSQFDILLILQKRQLFVLPGAWSPCVPYHQVGLKTYTQCVNLNTTKQTWWCDKLSLTISIRCCYIYYSELMFVCFARCVVTAQMMTEQETVLLVAFMFRM